MNSIAFSHTWFTDLGRHLVLHHLSSQGCMVGICKAEVVVGWCFCVVRVLLTGDLVVEEIYTILLWSFPFPVVQIYVEIFLKSFNEKEGSGTDFGLLFALH